MKKDEEGNVVATEQEMKDLAKSAASEAVNTFVKENKLDEVIKNGLTPKIEKVQPAILSAKKEARMWKYFQARQNKDNALALQIAEDSYSRMGQSVEKALGVAGGEGIKLVPLEYGTDLAVAIEQFSASGMCDNYIMDSASLTLRAVSTKPLVYAVSEATAPTAATPAFTNPLLTAKAFAGMQILSKEFFRDNNVNAYPQLIRLFAEALGAKEDLEIFVGSAFTGLAGSALTTTTLTSTSILDIKYKDIVNCVMSLTDGQKGPKPMFHMHYTTFGYIAGLVDDNSRPIVSEPWNPLARTLLGFPVYLSNQITSTDAAATDFVFFGDLNWVAFGRRDAIEANLYEEGTFGSVNVGECRSLALLIDTRWAVAVKIAANMAQITTNA